MTCSTRPGTRGCEAASSGCRSSSADSGTRPATWPIITSPAASPIARALGPPTAWQRPATCGCRTRRAAWPATTWPALRRRQASSTPPPRPSATRSRSIPICAAKPAASRTSPSCGRAAGSVRSWHDGGVTAYARFAGFYDQVMGDRSADIGRTRDYIKRYRPAARSLLELGCGTGAVLAGLTEEPSVTGGGLSVTGVDLSQEMLAAAARSVPAARLVHADVTSFSLRTRFDVAICVFDTLNHLPSLQAWRAM